MSGLTRRDVKASYAAATLGKRVLVSRPSHLARFASAPMRH